MEPDFSGFVSRANLQCADGRTIMPGAFAHQDGTMVPVVYQHNHSDIGQVLGKALLTAKPEGTWGDIYLNKEVPAGINAKHLVKNGDLDKFSIWAKELEEQGHLVHDGVIQEVSLVLAGANAGAKVENILMHSSTRFHVDDLLVVTGEIMHDGMAEKPEEPAEKVEPEAAEVNPLESLTEDQRDALNEVIDDVVTEAITKALAEEPELELTHDNMDSSKKGTNMSRNIHENFGAGKGGAVGASTATKELKHSDVVSVLSAAKGTPGNIRGFEEGSAVGSLREFVRGKTGQELMHADTYGIDNMDILFPDAQAVMQRPTWVDRRQEWVKVFLAGTSHSPFARVKTLHADITADEARARGYIKGNQKDFEVFPVFKRSTGPAWIYKMQKLDREDIINVTSFDVVAWMKAEMRGKLDEELARAALFGDGRPLMVGGEMNKDKIKDPGKDSLDGDGIRAIIADNDLYVTTYDVPMPANATGTQLNVLLDRRVETMEDYLGSGNLTAFMSYQLASKLLTIRDEFGHRVYRNLSEVAGDMDVAQIVKVPTALFPLDVLMIVLDLRDYNFGTDRGGEVTLFDDFDIRFNQYLYLIETYLSGALILPYSAQIFKRVDTTDTLVTPTKPAIAANVITIPTVTGVTYYRLDTNQVAAGGSTITLDDTVLPEIDIEARPADGTYYFGDDYDGRDQWHFEYRA